MTVPHSMSTGIAWCWQASKSAIARVSVGWKPAAAGLILLETNTQPGMTPTSLSPEQAEKTGMSFGKLCRWMVEDASCHR